MADSSRGALDTADADNAAVTTDASAAGDPEMRSHNREIRFVAGELRRAREEADGVCNDDPSSDAAPARGDDIALRIVETNRHLPREARRDRCRSRGRYELSTFVRKADGMISTMLHDSYVQRRHNHLTHQLG